MKVLIISLPRCGSTSLMKKLSIENNLESFMEPFSMEKIHPSYDYWDDKNNVVVKTLIGQPQLKDLVSFYLEFSKKFDDVILLSRHDLVAVSESFAYLKWNLDKGVSFDDKYHWEETPNLNETYKLITKLNDDLIKLSNNLKIPITYYEDIYDINSKDRLRKNKRVKTLI